MNRWTRILLPALVALAIASGCGKQDEKPATPPPPPTSPKPSPTAYRAARLLMDTSRLAFCDSLA
jgi:hypothetical protein